MNYYVNYNTASGAIITRYVTGTHDALIASPAVGTANLVVSESDAMLTASQMGYTVMSGALVPPLAPTAAQLLSAAKTAQIATLSQSYAASIQQSVSYMTTTFQADTVSQQTLTRCLVAGSVPAGFYWLDANNVQVTMTFAQLQGLASAMLVQGQTAFTKLQTRKASVNGATTVSAAQAVVW